jgi:hypothetical protein
MSRPRFLADHDLNEHIVAGVLRREPTTIFIRARDVGLAASPDAELLEYAAHQGVLVVSHDVNTMPAAAYDRITCGKTMSGLFMVNQSEPLGAVIDSLALIWSASEAEDWRDRVTFLPL